MGDFKTAFIEGLGKSLAYGVGGLIFLIVLGLLYGAGVLTVNRNPKLREFINKEN